MPLSDEDAGRLADRLIAHWMVRTDKSLAAIDRLSDALWSLPIVDESEIDRLVENRGISARELQPARLSERQLEVLQLVADGLHHAQISERLGISVGSVREHLVRVRARLRCTTTEQAVAIAVANGMVTAPLRETERGQRVNIRMRGATSITPRRAEVLRLIALGYTPQEISLELGKSTEAVKSQVKELRRVLGGRTTAHLVAIAFATGRLSMSDSRHTHDR